MPFAQKGGFEYNFTRENEFEELRQRYVELERQNNDLRSSLEQLLQVHEQLTLRFEQLQNMNQQGQNAQQMQQKIDLLTQQVQTLRKQIQQVQYEKSKTSNRRDSNALYEDKQRTEQVVQILEELTKSFESVQVNYQDQIDQLQNDMNVLKAQWGGNYKKLEQQYNEKIHTFEDVITQLKRKDEIVSMIEDKLKMSEDALRAIIEGSQVEQQQIPKPEVKTSAMISNQNGTKRPVSINNEEREKFISEIDEKNRIIQAYQELILKLRQRLEEKF